MTTRKTDEQILAECAALDAAYAHLHEHVFARLHPGTLDTTVVCACGLIVPDGDDEDEAPDPVRDGWIGKDGRP